MIKIMGPATLPGVYRLTYADWLRFPDDGLRYEILGGELFVTPAPSIRHQRISRDLEFHLLEHLRRTGRGEVLYAPVGVRLSDEEVLEPDLLVVLTEHRDRIGEQTIEGAPDLIVEILSPGSAARDLGRKRELYARAGVPEYWIVDPAASAVEVLVLEPSGYARFGLFGRSDTLRSPLLPGLAIPLDAVLAEPPKPGD